MDSPPKLTGETLVVHHIPLVHCQVPDRQCCGATRRTSPFHQSDLRPSSFPEWNLLPPDSLAYSSFLQNPTKEQEEPESAPQTLASSGVTKRQNPFLLRDSEAWDFHEDDPGQRSFHLHHSQPTFCLHELALPPFHLHNSNPVVKPWGGSGGVEGHSGPLAEEDAQKRSHLVPERMELDESSGLGGDQSSFHLEPQWASKSDELMNNQEPVRSRTCSCSSSDMQPCRCYSLSSQSEPLDQQMGYVSDSSCNSSDGVLVNFSALYHQRNSHPHARLNSGSLSGDSSSGSQSDSGAFYLDLHSSPQEAKRPGELPDLEGPGKACGCHRSGSPLLDANCNSYPPLCDPCLSDDSDLPACFQSQARLVVATQNYYKLVTCDLSSQSSPSPPGSSITSCSEEQTQSSPGQPTEYYLFQRPEQSDTDGSREGSQGEADKNTIEGQVYINVSPPSLAGGRQRSRSYDRHLDRSPSSRLGSLERMLSCPVKLSDSTTLSVQSSLPKRVTSFAELAKGRKKNGSSPPLRSSRDSSLEFSPIPEGQKDSSVLLEDQTRHSRSLSPVPVANSLGRGSEGELGVARKGPACREGPPCGQERSEQPFASAWPEMGPSSVSILGQKDVRARADGGVADGKVVRYSKDQRPTTLPIQPFVFQHHFPKPPKARALSSHFASSLSQLYTFSAASRSASQQLLSTSQSSASTTSADPLMGAEVLGPGPGSADGAASLGSGCAKQQPVPENTRLSPLGSYSPVRNNVPFFQSMDSSSSCSSSPESHPPRSQSCPVSANLLPSKGPSPAAGSCATQAGPRASTLPRGSENPSPLARKAALPEPLGPLAKDKPPHSSFPPLSSIVRGLATVGSSSEPPWKIGSGEAAKIGPLGIVIPRPLNANHLSPQALKWREYRRRNPLGLDRVSDLAGLTSSLDWKQPESRPPWRNPLLEITRLHGQSVKQPQLGCPDFFPDYFSLAEKPPAEFCLSPDGNTESISIDLLQKKGLVKAVNVAVDLIVAHFGTSRDPGVKAKLGNSSVSPNVGHLVLKYLCPAIQDILSDGLKAYVLDVIVGQRRNTPWSIVEASTQLGPSTKVLHSLYSRVSQYPQLTSHHMRFHAFVFGLLNLGSLEFWFNHLYNHEDIIQAHYQPAGFLSLSRGACQGLFEEVLLLLQPLSLLPFRLDLLFESRLLQVGQEQQQQKELLRLQQDLLLSCHSTLQLMRSQGGSSCAQRSVEPPPGHPPTLERAGRAKGVGAPAASSEGRGQEGSLEQKKADRQATWWLQLTQSSQVYIEGSAEGARLSRSERKKKAGPVATRQAETRRGPPPREGVVEGAEACPLKEAPHDRAKPPAEEIEPPWRKGPPAGEQVEEKNWPSWMGSPPDAVLTELKRSKEEERGMAPGREQSAPCTPERGQPKWARLFGLRQAPKAPKPANRLPSGWLTWDGSMLQQMVQTVGASMWREADAEPTQPPAVLPPSCPKVQPSDGGVSARSSWAVKALCHHLATEAGQLSFKKGDVLQVLDKVDADWLRCSRGGGAESGLVPIMYVTHVEDVDY